MRADRRSSYRSLLRYARPYWRAWMLIVGATLAASLLAIAQPWPMQVLADHVLGDKPMPAWLHRAVDAIGVAGSRPALLVGVVVAGLVIFLLTTFSEAIQSLGAIRVGQRMVNDLSADLFARLQRRSIAYHQRVPIGDSMALVISDFWSVYRLCDVAVMRPLHAVPVLVIALVLMSAMDLVLTGVSLIAAPIMALSAVYFGRGVRAAATRRQKADIQLQSHVQETLSGLAIVQSFGQETREQRRFRGHADQALRAHRQTLWSTSLYQVGGGLTAAVGTAVILWLAGQRVLAGQLSIGQALVFISYLAMLQGQIRSLLSVHSTFQQQRVHADRVFEILNAADDLPVSTPARELHGVRGNVRLEGVTFGYEPGRPVVRDIDLEASLGEVVAIVGPTGSGKSTLLNLVPRFYDPWAGHVSIDGIDVRTVPLESLRRQVALVPQEALLFPISIADNIAFGIPGASREQITAAAQAANADDFIRALPAGYDTLIGQRGATLSGGERQRISIARALLLDAPILLLDEPTAALDSDSEVVVMAALERLMRCRTTLVVAHRLSTIRRADRIVVIQDGRVVESGTHDALLSAAGFYASLHQVLGARGDGGLAVADLASKGPTP